LRLAATGVRGLTAIADRGYFKGEEILACEAAGVTPIVPKPLTSGAKADGRFGKQDFVYDPGADRPEQRDDPARAPRFLAKEVFSPAAVLGQAVLSCLPRARRRLSPVSSMRCAG
jgi:hypothetical protein